MDFRRRGRITDEDIQAIKVQGCTGPWLSGPADLPEFMAEARRCDGFADREADFEIAWAATEVMPVFRPSVV